MSYTVFARKYRPQKFNEVYAQNHITRVLENAIEMDRIAHAYLFTGPRGVGKTSMARIFAKSLNCVEGPTSHRCNVCENCVEITKSISSDVIEIDGASNTSVNDIRELQKELMYSTEKSNYKIYIIDEVHMLSKSAFNALLKTLEEPPERVIFIFATTEPHKVLPTIISRCQRFDFKRIPIDAIIERIESICENENIKIENEAAFTIAKKADGGMRDALSLLDQIISYAQKEITLESTLKIFGIVHTEIFLNVLNNISEQNAPDLIKLLHAVIDKGNDLQEFFSGLLDWTRNLLFSKLGLESTKIKKNYIKSVEKVANNFSENDLIYLMSYLVKTKANLKSSNNPVLIAEMALIKLSKLRKMKNLEELINNISNKELKVSSTPDSYKKSKPDLHRKLDSVKTRIDKEVKKEKLHIEKLTKEILRNEWKYIERRLQSELPLIVNFFEDCSLEDISNELIHFQAKSELAYSKLNKNRKTISKIFSDHLNLKLRVSFTFKKKKKQNIIKNPTLQDIEKEAPNIAKFIKDTDSMITQE